MLIFLPERMEKFEIDHFTKNFVPTYFFIQLNKARVGSGSAVNFPDP